MVGRVCLYSVLLISMFLVTALGQGFGPFGEPDFISQYRVETNSSVIYFDPQIPGVIHHGRDVRTGEVSENAFKTYLNEILEIDYLTGETVQRADVTQIVFAIDFNLPILTRTEASGLSFVNAYRMVYTDVASGTTMVFFVFREDQIITDLITNRTTFVPEGSVKISISLPLWPFLNDKNEFQIEANTSTIIPDQLTECYYSDENTRELSSLECRTRELSGVLQLQNTGTVFNYVTQRRSTIATPVLFFACPTPDFEIPNIIPYGDIYGSYCNVSLNQLGKFPSSAASLSTAEEDVL